MESSVLMKSLNPRFSLVGSTQEGSRIGVGNEIDVTMKFMAWETFPPFEITNDAFHLQKSDTCPKWMHIFFNSNGHFCMESFILDVCEAVSTSLDVIFNQKRNPRNLNRLQDNGDYDRSKCDYCKIQGLGESGDFYVQCEFCTVCVSRTKMGICLQFLWLHEQIEKPFYCSIDLVPAYNIIPKNIKSVIQMVNMAMIGKYHPKGWYNNLVNFLKEDRIVEELWSEGEHVDKVLLKSLGGGRYFIRGGQQLNSEVLQKNKRLLKIYIFLKALRAYLGIENLSNFRIKKILMGPTFVSMASSATFFSDLIKNILSHDMFRVYFESHINLQTMKFKKVQRPFT